MIDTIILVLKQDMFTILERDKFTPSASEIYNASYQRGGRAFRKCTQNPTPRELESGNYKPRLTLTRRVNREGNYEITLRIEFSIPKLLFGNNFDELENDDLFDAVIILQRKLREMGVDVSEVNLATAPVSVIHCSKNIVLTDYTTPLTYIKQLTKLNINQNLDTNQTDFRNEGHSWKYRANTFEIAFYDKLRDIEYAGKSKKRAEEKNNVPQLDLFNNRLKEGAFEVLRIEIRLNTRQKIKHIFRKIDTKIEPTFFSVFSQNTAKKVLLYYLNEIEKAYPPLLMSNKDKNIEFFNGLLISNPKVKLHTALKLTGLRTILQEIGVREFRHIIKRYGKPAWYALNKQMKTCKKSSDTPNVFPFLKQEIKTFKPLKLIDFQAKMLNNDKYGN